MSGSARQTVRDLDARARAVVAPQVDPYERNRRLLELLHAEGRAGEWLTFAAAVWRVWSWSWAEKALLRAMIEGRIWATDDKDH